MRQNPNLIPSSVSPNPTHLSTLHPSPHQSPPTSHHKPSTASARPFPPFPLAWLLPAPMAWPGSGLRRQEEALCCPETLARPLPNSSPGPEGMAS